MFRLAFCYVKKMRRNTLICIIGIAISIMLLFSLVQIGELIIGNYKNMILSSSNYDYIIKGMDKETSDEIHKAYQSRWRMTQAIFCAESPENAAICHYVVGADGDWMNVFQIELLEGAAPTGDREICLEQFYAVDKGIRVGDIISLPLEIGYTAEITADFVVSGIISNTPDYHAGSFMFVSIDAAENILQGIDRKQLDEAPDYVEYILMNSNGFPDEEDSSELYSHIFETYGKDVFVNIQVNDRKLELESDRGLYHGISLIIWGIVAFIAVVMTIFIYYMMQIGFQAKMDQYGTMRALGSSNAKIGRMIISELFIYGCVGMVLGNLAGIIFNKIFAKMIIRIFVGERIERIQTSYQMVLYVVGIVALSMIVVYLRIMLELMKKNPIELLHNTDDVIKKKIFNCKNDIADMAVNNIFRNKRSSSALLVTMTLAFLTVLLLGNGLGSISFEFGNTMFAFADLEVTVMPDLEMLLGQSGIEEEALQALKQYADEVYYQGGTEYTAYDDNTELQVRVWIYSQNLMEQLIRLQHLNQGTHVVFTGPDEQALKGKQIIMKDGSGRSISVEIDAAIEGGLPNLAGQTVTGMPLIIIGEDYARELLGKEPKWVDVYLSGKNMTAEDVEKIVSADKYIVYDFSSIMGEEVTQMQMILILFAYMMVALMGLVVFMITSIVKQNFEHRRKEIGMMRAIGASRKRMEFMLCGEVFLLVTAACVAASVFAAPVSMYVYKIINEKAGMDATGYLTGIPVILLLCGVVIYGNVRKCMKEKTMELLRNEG
ncbi:MAG: ABC transporter permease [Lachnospiraceae bacterium]|nr:ABC transporter permease [Lachnospiraceae bacterium]